MKPPGYLRSAWLVAVKDLRIEFKTLQSLSAMVLFSLIVLVVFNFASDLGSIRKIGAGRLVPGVIWVTLCFASLVGFSRSFQVERRRESISALLLAPVEHGALFLGKAFANLVTILALELLIIPLSAVFFDYDLLAVAGPLSLVLLMHTVGLAVLGTLLAAVASKVGRGEALLATLLFPLATPLFISAVRCTGTVLEGQQLSEASGWMLIALGFDLLFLFTGLLVFDHIVEE